ncbi:retropepsin-like aspartic protease family protein [Iodobacter fluviatilis]|uniref:Aspartyl protease family protein n=1 Tax=Iodobacter fluviatilis TaxID=537 RepID=A0A377SWQ6_9NEIS|nr:retropepsin-like aspartic protease [Iodobacter fluviatilis]TCU88249.1 aspartyl protease family protein [Iodobacter fluviatilis]STR45750.1 Predicted aspartyl protease [Iodobacter fluviatilis]
MKRLALLLTLMIPLAFATEVTLLAAMGNKGILLIDGQKKTLAIGQQMGEVKLLAVSSEQATVMIGTRQRQLLLGQGYIASTKAESDSAGSLTLSPDAQGHYFADIAVRGISQRGIIDTGASFLSLPRNLASNMGVDYKQGEESRTQTANGTIKSWQLTIAQIRIGSLLLNNVQASIRDQDNGPLLIGNSVLNRFQMKREQELLILQKKNYQ